MTIYQALTLRYAIVWLVEGNEVEERMGGCKHDIIHTVSELLCHKHYFPFTRKKRQGIQLYD